MWRGRLPIVQCKHSPDGRLSRLFHRLISAARLIPSAVDYTDPALRSIRFQCQCRIAGLYRPNFLPREPCRRLALRGDISFEGCRSNNCRPDRSIPTDCSNLQSVDSEVLQAHVASTSIIPRLYADSWHHRDHSLSSSSSSPYIAASHPN